MLPADGRKVLPADGRRVLDSVVLKILVLDAPAAATAEALGLLEAAVLEAPAADTDELLTAAET